MIMIIDHSLNQPTIPKIVKNVVHLSIIEMYSIF
jgi:hypothetical protein